MCMVSYIRAFSTLNLRFKKTTEIGYFFTDHIGYCGLKPTLMVLNLLIFFQMF